MKRSLVMLTAVATFAAGCHHAERRPVPAASAAPATSAAPAAHSARPASTRASAVAPRGSAAAPAPAPIPAATFAGLFRALSGPDHEFFSDNYISNETSYLQVAPALEKRAAPDRAYIGVGPEQNFTYIALTRPKLAFIVDIRRDNALLQLLYKALFDRARSRTEFLALLLGRPFDASADPGAKATVDEVIAAVERSKPDQALFERTQRQLVDRISKGYGIPLTANDRATLEKTHRAFFDGQLALAFKLKPPNGRHYPSLRSLFEARDPAGREQGFLASSAAFSFVQKLERTNRVVPVVGDFAGTHALAAIGRELSRRHLRVGAFYVSNVEQYVMDPPKWEAWVKNVEALPSDEQSLFIRCYLDQGRRHPLEMQGQRTATVLQLLQRFETEERAHGYHSFYQLATDGVLGE